MYYYFIRIDNIRKVFILNSFPPSMGHIGNRFESYIHILFFFFATDGQEKTKNQTYYSFLDTEANYQFPGYDDETF